MQLELSSSGERRLKTALICLPAFFTPPGTPYPVPYDNTLNSKSLFFISHSISYQKGSRVGSNFGKQFQICISLPAVMGVSQGDSIAWERAAKSALLQKGGSLPSVPVPGKCKTALGEAQQKPSMRYQAAKKQSRWKSSPPPSGSQRYKCSQQQQTYLVLYLKKKMLKCKLVGRSFQFFIAEFYPPNCYEDLLR